MACVRRCISKQPQPAVSCQRWSRTRRRLRAWRSLVRRRTAATPTGQAVSGPFLLKTNDFIRRALYAATPWPAAEADGAPMSAGFPSPPLRANNAVGLYVLHAHKSQLCRSSEQRPRALKSAQERTWPKCLRMDHIFNGGNARNLLIYGHSCH